MSVDQRVVGPFTLAPDTSILAANDLTADTLVLSSVLRAKNIGGVLQEITLYDTANQGAALTLVFLSANISLGTVNSQPNISAANSLSILGVVSFLTTDYIALTSAIKVATKVNLGIYLKPATDTQDIYVGVINAAGTPTYTANSLRLRLGVSD